MGSACSSAALWGSDTPSDGSYSNLFEKYGGQPTINSLIDHLFVKVQKHITLKHKFRGLQMDRIK